MLQEDWLSNFDGETMLFKSGLGVPMFYFKDSVVVVLGIETDLLLSRESGDMSGAHVA